MALNKATFQTRSLSAIVFVIVMLCGLLTGGISFLLLCALIAGGCLFEMIRLINRPGMKRRAILFPTGILYVIISILLLTDLGFGCFFSLHVDDRHNCLSSYSCLFPLLIFSSLWVNDTMAYIVGSFIGKTPLSKISPKKTVEGTVGGALICVVVIGCAGYFFAHTHSPHWFGIAAVCAVFGTLGDLVESKLKRMAAVKDSGNLMPGHGGFLDRFDSLLLAAPFAWLYVRLFIL